MIPNSIVQFYNELMESNKRTHKIEVLRKWIDCPEIVDFLKFMYDPLITLGVTASGVHRYGIFTSHYNSYSYDLFTLLHQLSTRELSGNAALDACYDAWSKAAKEKQADLMDKILDKNLKAGIDAKTINTVRPIITVFEVALAFDIKKSKKAYNLLATTPYVIMRKLDGVRLITVINGRDDIRFYSRTGNEFTSLDRLRSNLSHWFRDTDQFVLDGELCVIENNMENFKLAVSQITHKNEQMERPFYKIFDMMTIDQFFKGVSTDVYSERLQFAQNWFNQPLCSAAPWFSIMEYTPYTNRESLLEMQSYADQHGWEGLMLRADVPYRNGRTNDLLKVKTFKTDEFVIEGITMTTKMMPNLDGTMCSVPCAGAVVVRYQGSPVFVGSGFTDEQRIDMLRNQVKYIGRTITVKYFEETTDVNGKPSLRFPIFVGFRDGATAI